MGTKIKSVTLVNSQGTRYYEVGREVNGLLIDRIIDNSQEFPDSTEFIYEGMTADDNRVFSAINVPADIQYYIP